MSFGTAPERRLPEMFNRRTDRLEFKAMGAMEIINVRKLI
jgi:hypothetical protein